MALMSTLVDPFTATSLQTSLWTQFTSADGTTLSYDATGAQVNYPAATTAATDGDISSNVTYSLVGSFGWLQVLSVPAAGGATDAEMRFQINASNYVRWVYEGGTLFAQYNVAGVKTTPFSVAYDSNAHRFWQIRESNGITFWETSSTGLMGSWVTRAAVANPITLTALTVLIAGLGTAVHANPGTFKWKYFNYPQPGTTTSTSSTSASTFSTSSTSSSISSTSSSTSSTSRSTSTSSTSSSISSTSSSVSSTSASTSSTSSSSTSASTSVSSTSSSISSTSFSSTSQSSTSSSISVSSTSSSVSSTSSSISSTSASTSSTSLSSTSSSVSTSTTTVPNLTYSYDDLNLTDTPTLVQSANNSSLASNAVASVTVTLGSTPVVGNLLVAVAGSDATVFNPPGFTKAAVGIANQACYIWYKIAGPNESTGVTFTPSTSDTIAAAVLEYSTTSGWGPEILDGATAATGTGGTFTSGIGGRTNVTTASLELAIAIENPHSWAGTAPASPTWSNSFTNQVTVAGTTGSTTGIRVALFVADKTLTGQQAVTTTGSWTNASVNFGMCIATFKIAASIPPKTNANLTTFNATNYANVLDDDGDYFIEYGSKYVIQQFKRKWTNNTDAPSVNWRGRTTESTLTAPILLQVYNQNTASWETLRRVANVPADTDFTISATVTGTLANYYDSTLTVSFRVYQLVV